MCGWMSRTQRSQPGAPGRGRAAEVIAAALTAYYSLWSAQREQQLAVELSEVAGGLSNVAFGAGCAGTARSSRVARGAGRSDPTHPPGSEKRGSDAATGQSRLGDAAWPLRDCATVDRTLRAVEPDRACSGTHR